MEKANPLYNEKKVAEGVNRDAAVQALMTALGEYPDNPAKFRAVYRVLGEVASGVNPMLTVTDVYDHEHPNVRVYQGDQPLINVSRYMIGATANFTAATHNSAFINRGNSLSSEWDAPFMWVAAFTGFPSQKSWKPELQLIA